jgi:DNA-binding CsgD family transcriptional regulator
VRARQAVDTVRRLTEREREILGSVAEARSNRSIAQALSISPKTVEGAIGIIFAKLGLEDHNRRVLST